MFVSNKKIYFLSSVLWHFHVSTKIWTIASFLLRVYCRYVFYLQCETLYGLADQCTCMQHLQILLRRLYTEMKASSFYRDLLRKKCLLTLVTFKKVWRILCVFDRYHQNKNVCLISKWYVYKFYKRGSDLSKLFV